MVVPRVWWHATLNGPGESFALGTQEPIVKCRPLWNLLAPIVRLLNCQPNLENDVKEEPKKSGTEKRAEGK